MRGAGGVLGRARQAPTAGEQGQGEAEGRGPGPGAPTTRPPLRPVEVPRPGVEPPPLRPAVPKARAQREGVSRRGSVRARLPRGPQMEPGGRRHRGLRREGARAPPGGLPGNGRAARCWGQCLGAARWDAPALPWGLAGLALGPRGSPSSRASADCPASPVQGHSCPRGTATPSCPACLPACLVPARAQPRADAPGQPCAGASSGVAGRKAGARLQGHWAGGWRPEPRGIGGGAASGRGPLGVWCGSPSESPMALVPCRPPGVSRVGRADGAGSLPDAAARSTGDAQDGPPRDPCQPSSPGGAKKAPHPGERPVLASRRAPGKPRRSKQEAA